ncbi:MAG TPA: membrane protein insertion efficiency factor YidD [Verrucomicrobiae bacterium]|nr:membrane protein insertion efficiency factor YidD [Verrucomicrobiae bacterium]
MSPRTVALALIRWYQQVWSPDHSPRKSQYPLGYCRFTPSCSEYGYQAIERYGILKGGILALWRIIRCNPWNRGGHDPLP